MVGAAEVEVDTETGEVKLLEFDACVDCGTPINPNLTRVQAEGGLLQGIGMTLTENITYDKNGYPEENSLFQYKIPARTDVGKIKVEFESSYEPNGPFGAKSIGEVVINTPLPAISDAIYNAIGTRFYELPITPAKNRHGSCRKAEMIDAKKVFSVSCGEGTCYFSGGRRRKDHTDVQSGCALRPQGLAGIGRYHHPYYAAARRGLGTDGCRAFPSVEVRQLCRGWNRCTRRQIDGPAAGTAGALDDPLQILCSLKRTAQNGCPARHPLRTSRCFYRSAIRFWP